MPSTVVLAHHRAGSGEPLVLTHPLGADRSVWQPVLGRLAARHDVIAVDMPGFGDSPVLPDPAPATARAIAACIEATLESIGVERAHVAGISLGGWVALEFAKNDRCLSVTALSPAGFWARPLGPRPEIARGVSRMLVPLLRPLLSTERGRHLLLRGSIAHPERVPPAEAYRLVRSYATAPGFENANAEMRKTLFDGFEQIGVPITLAWAEHDRLVSPPRSVPANVHTAPMLRGCGHVPTWDDPEQVAKVILENTARATRSPGALSA